MVDQLSQGWDKIVGSARSAAVQLHVRSAINPMLWESALVSLPCFGFSYLFKSDAVLSDALLVVGTLPILAAVGGYIYFSIVAPERLQSEDYQLKHEALEIIKQKGTDIEVLPSSIEAISDPAVRSSRPREGR